MHHACQHAYAGSAAFAGPAAFHNDPISLLSSIGPMAFLGMLLLGVLGAVYFLMWATQQGEAAHADMGAITERSERPRQREAPSEDGPRVSFARYDRTPQVRQAPYEHEQPQAQYPEMPLDEPYPPEPGKYD